MIILTGNEGFIGKAFEKKLDPENLYRVGQSGADLFLEQYEDWDEEHRHDMPGPGGRHIDNCRIESPLPIADRNQYQSHQ